MLGEEVVESSHLKSRWEFGLKEVFECEGGSFCTRGNTFQLVIIVLSISY